jgi:hypothetical protein
LLRNTKKDISGSYKTDGRLADDVSTP